MYSSIPPQLRSSGLFCCWRYDQRKGKPTKVPYDPMTGAPAKSNDPTTFADFETACSASRSYNGLGIGIFNGVSAIDLDDCITESGQLTDTATEIVKLMHSYTEYSPSGKGLHILFTVGGATLICRLLEGDFLDWRKVVPINCPVKLVANVSDLSASIERVGLIVSEKYKSPVRCVFGDQVVQLRTNTTIGAAEDRCSLAGDGKELEIGFNVRYLADALRVVPSEEVVLELTNGLSPIVLSPADDKYDFAYMVLPVRIKNG